MKHRHVIDNFIRFRMQGKTYDEIVTKLGVSKVTLIKWSKVYRDELEVYRTHLTGKLAEKIAKDNKELLNIIAENLRSAKRNNTAPVKIKNKFIKKSYKRLGDIFKIEVKNVSIVMNDDGDVTNVFINVKE